MGTPPGRPESGGGRPRGRAGDEVATARSPLTLRLVLASFGLLLWAVIGVAVLVGGGPTWLGVAAVVLVVVSVVDLLVVARRKRRGDTG